MTLGTSEKGVVEGKICFAKGVEVAEADLVNVPTARGGHSLGTKTINLVTGPPLGGQCLRHDSQ